MFDLATVVEISVYFIGVGSFLFFVFCLLICISRDFKKNGDK